MIFKNNRYEILWDGVSFFNLGATGQNLGKLRPLSESVDLFKSTLSTSTFSFDVFNVNDVFTKFLYDKLNSATGSFFNDIVEVFKIDDKGVRHAVYKGYVRTVKPVGAYEVSYSVTLESVISKLKEGIWQRELSEYQNETIANINTGRLSKGFVASTYTADGKSRKKIKFGGHIMDCYVGMIQMLLSTPKISVGTNFIDKNWEDFVDKANVDSLRTSLTDPMYTVSFEFLEPLENVFDFLQTQIFQGMAILPKVNPEGKLYLTKHQLSSVPDNPIGLDNSKIIRHSGRTIDNSGIVNNVVVGYNYNATENKFGNSVYRVDSGSFKFFGNELHPTTPLKFGFKGLNMQSDVVKSDFINSMIDDMFLRFSREVNGLNVVVPIQVGFEIETGGYVQVSSDILIDWDKGTRGYTTVAQVSSFAIIGSDNWGAFISNNTIGVASNNVVVANTQDRIISMNFFNSLKAHESKINDFLNLQGV